MTIDEIIAKLNKRMEDPLPPAFAGENGILVSVTEAEQIISHLRRVPWDGRSSTLANEQHTGVDREPVQKAGDKIIIAHEEGQADVRAMLYLRNEIGGALPTDIQAKEVLRLLVRDFLRRHNVL